MVMRSRGGGGGGGAPRRGARTSGVQAVLPVYENFRPISEWQQDDDSHILKIYLPGFMKEQIRVTTEGRNTIRVRGERLVAGNKWSRFQEDFQVPENGEMNSVRAKFQEGVLNISVPKKQVGKLHETLAQKPKGNDVHNQATTIKEDEKDKALPEVYSTSSQPVDEKGTPKQQPSARKEGQEGDHKKTTPQKSQDKAFPAIGSTSQSSGEKSLESQNYKRKHDQNGDQNAGIERSDESKRKHFFASDDLTSKAVNKERKHNTVGTKESPEGETAFGKMGATDIPGKKKVDSKEKELSGAITKKALKGLVELNEERQLLVNMGVAMLVIVALTACVTYKFASGKDKN